MHEHEVSKSAQILEKIRETVEEPAWLRSIETCRQKDYHFVSSVDSNAHSILWGSNGTNARGHDMEDLTATACHWFNSRKCSHKFEISCQEKLHILRGLSSTCTSIEMAKMSRNETCRAKVVKT